MTKYEVKKYTEKEKKQAYRDADTIRSLGNYNARVEKNVGGVKPLVLVVEVKNPKKILASGSGSVSQTVKKAITPVDRRSTTYKTPIRPSGSMRQTSPVRQSAQVRPVAPIRPTQRIGR